MSRNWGICSRRVGYVGFKQLSSSLRCSAHRETLEVLDHGVSVFGLHGVNCVVRWSIDCFDGFIDFLRFV